ncbi:DUF1707 SHOCT-like domain-containing protein [Phaeacidiphilus oryzae]|uniref:DUF1707 SHOCT-like domain-containing protein n=1 Tax=Phaeacidiphilus oryzae TaxID=348818 RepID=UPI0009FEA8A1|nr:DUF1707 domain-containing protein [Phaeacidiphilus oryzae]
MSLAAVPAEPAKPADTGTPGASGTPGKPGEPARSQPPLRASDADRDRIAAVLADAVATGRLEPAEHAERLEAAYAARTLVELAPLTADLPQDAGAAPEVPEPRSEPVVATLSKIRRGGQCQVAPHTVVRSRFGAIILDLRHAVFTRREVVIEAGSFCGKIHVIVPAGAQVQDEGSALMGKRAVSGRRSQGEGPVIRFTGRSVLGKLLVTRAGEAPWAHLLPWGLGD